MVADRPVLALDVDGVLNALSPESPRKRETVVVCSGEVPDSPFVRRPSGGNDAIELSVRLDAGADGPWISEMGRLAEVVWATTWEDLANAVIAPRLGIEPLPVLRVKDFPPRFWQVRSLDSVGWKIEALDAYYGERQVLLVDDRASWVARPPMSGRGGWTSGLRALVPDSELGLGSADRRRIAAILGSVR